MNQMRYLALALFITVLLAPSCSIEKRVHMPGYHVKWNKTYNSLGKSDDEQEKSGELRRNSFNQIASNTDQDDFNHSDDVLQMSNRDLEEVFLNKPASATSKSKRLFNNKKEVSQATHTSKNRTKLDNECDIIILKNGDEIKAKVLEVGKIDIKYKNCDNQDGPTFIKSSSEVFMIKYPNGTKTVLKEEEKAKSVVSVNIDKNTSKDSADNNSSGKSLTVAVVLWFLLGVIGIHRMYLGYVGLGIVYLLTAGFCGIGWIVDGILFLAGSLKPKNGRYTE